MKSYFFKFRGTRDVYTVNAETEKEAREKFARFHNIKTDSSYIQRVWKCDYQDMREVIIK